jgi:hypothetical protein
MLIIKDGAGLEDALNSPLDPAIKALLQMRRDQLASDGCALAEIANWVIVGPGDSLSTIEATTGFPLEDPSPWEWVLDHGELYEAPIIVSDDGFGIVLIVPDCEVIVPTLLALLRRDASRAT